MHHHADTSPLDYVFSLIFKLSDIPPFYPYFILETTFLCYLFVKLGFSRTTISMIIGANLVQVYYLFSTRIYTLAPDEQGHISYIIYIVTHHFNLPPPAGWQYQQPPLYYLWCSAAYEMGQYFSFGDEWISVRIASRILYHVFLIFTVLLVERFRFSAPLKYAALAAIIFSPAAYMIATRTNNDLGYMALSMPSLFLLVRWIETLRHRFLAGSIVCACLAFSCKATGLISIVTIASVIAYALFSRKITLSYFKHRTSLIAASAIALSFALYFGRLAYYMFFKGSRLYWFANVQPNSSAPYTPASLFHFVYFHVWDFISLPGYYWQPANANLYTYWDFMFRTLLFTTEKNIFPVPAESDMLLCIISFFWVAICVLALVQLVRNLLSRELDSYKVICFALITSIGMTMIQRYVTPDRYLANGRYIYPVLVLIIILMAGFAQRLRDQQHKIGYAAICTMIFSFAALSEFFCFEEIHWLLHQFFWPH